MQPSFRNAATVATAADRFESFRPSARGGRVPTRVSRRWRASEDAAGRTLVDDERAVRVARPRRAERVEQQRLGQRVRRVLGRADDVRVRTDRSGARAGQSKERQRKKRNVKRIRTKFLLIPILLIFKGKNQKLMLFKM